MVKPGKFVLLALDIAVAIVVSGLKWENKKKIKNCIFSHHYITTRNTTGSGSAIECRMSSWSIEASIIELSSLCCDE